MDENRQFIRIDKSLSVNFEVFKEPVPSKSRSKDISEGGIRLPLSKRLSHGTILKLWIYLEETREPVVALGEVVWVTVRDDKDYPYETGVKFIKIEQLDRSRLYNYINKITG